MSPYFTEAWKSGDASAPRFTVNDAKSGCREYGAPSCEDGRGNYGNRRQPNGLRSGKAKKARRVHNKRARAVLKRDLAQRSE